MSRALFCAGLLALCPLAAAALGRRPPRAPKIQEEAPMEWRGSFCPVAEPKEMTITTQAGWEKLWETLGKPAPAADFSRDFAAAVFAGTKPTGGYGVIFSDLIRENGGSVLRYRVRPPKGMAIEALTQPYAVRLYPRADLPLRFERIEGARP